MWLLKEEICDMPNSLIRAIGAVGSIECMSCHLFESITLYMKCFFPHHFSRLKNFETDLLGAFFSPRMCFLLNMALWLLIRLSSRFIATKEREIQTWHSRQKHGQKLAPTPKNISSVMSCCLWRNISGMLCFLEERWGCFLSMTPVEFCYGWLS